MASTSAFQERFVIPWETVTTDTNMVVNTGYVLDGTTDRDFLLPANSSVGDVVAVLNVDTALFTITQAVGQTVYLPGGTSTTGSGGSVASTAQYDGIQLVCTVANSDWVAFFPQGIFTVT